VAAPIVGPGRDVVAAISVVFPADRLLQPRVRSALLMTARAVSRELGGRVVELPESR